jgi:AraC-like DNA-binding protein
MVRRKTERRRRALLKRAERIIKERYGEFGLSLGDVAAEAGCSTRQLQLVFRETGGTTFRDHLLRVRMEHAHGLFSRKTGNWSVRKVARAVGYKEASGLRPRFKAFYGYNPSEVGSEGYDYDAAWRAAERADLTDSTAEGGH